MEPLLELLVVLSVASFLAANRWIWLSAVRVTLLPALMSLPWISRLPVSDRPELVEGVPAPVAVVLMLMLPPAATVPSLAKLLTIELVAAHACICWAGGGFDESNSSVFGIASDFLHLDDLQRALVVLDEILLALLAVSATAIMQLRDALKMRR